MRTPWGESDAVKKYDHGILFVTTPSHGGYLVPRNIAVDMMPDAIFLYALTSKYGGVFEDFIAFEEDCEAYLVDYSFPTFAPKGQWENVVSMVKNIYPEIAKKLEIA